MAKKIRIIPELDESRLRQQLNDIGKRREKIKVDLDSNNINNANKHMRQLNNTAANSNTVFGKLKSTINNTFSTSRMTMTGFLAVLNEINKAGKKAKETIQDIDKAITDLSIATNESRESVSNLIKDYNDYAKQLKSTTVQVTSAADDYLRAGKTMSEAEALIQSSVMLSKLGQLDSAEATEDILAIMNGFSMSVDEVSHALDTMVALDMEASISAGQIATALSYCSSSADAAGISFDKLASMISVTREKTMQSAETIGTFFNTILSRYRDVKIGNYITEDGEDISDYESVLKSVGIQLRDTEGEFRNFETVIQEMALNWNSLSSVQQAALGKVASGTRQQNRFYALMQGYSKVLELTETAANSAGTAIDKFNNSYSNSLEAKGNTLQASFESMVINSDFSEVYSGIIEATTALVDFINQTNALKGAMSGIAVAGGIKTFLAIRTGINEAYISLNKFGNALNIVKQTKISTRDFDRLLLLSNGLNTSQMKLILSTNNLSVARKKQLLMASGLSEQEAVLQLQTWKMTTAQTGLTAATTTLGNAFKGLWATIISQPIMLVTMAISCAVMTYQSYNQKLEETRQKNIEASESAIEQANSLEELYSKYVKLSSIQNRTSSEEDEFKSVVEEVTKVLGNKAEMLEGLTAGTDKYAEALKNATKAELESQYTSAKIGAKAAEEELKGKAYSAWTGSQITIQMNTQMTGVEEHMAALEAVRGILAEYEDEGTNGFEWEPINWDENNSDMNAVVEYYNALIEARNKLVTAENADFLMSSDIYKSINSTINSLSESVEQYIEQQYNALKLNYEWQNGIPQTTEEYNRMKNTLLSTANAGEYLQSEFSTLLASDFSNLAIQLEEVSKAVETIVTEEPVELWDFSTLFENLDSAKDKLATLDEAFSKLFDDADANTNIGFEDFSAIHEAFSDVSNIEDYITRLQDAGQNAEQVRLVMEDLIGAYLEQSQILDNVTNENKDLIITMLKEMGVINAEEIVLAQLSQQTEILAIQKQFATEKGYELINATIAEANEFINEAECSDVAKQALAQLALEKINVNNQKIDTSSDIDNVIALANAAGASALAIAKLEQAKKMINSESDGTVAWLRQYEAATATIEAIENGTFDYGYEAIDPDKFKLGTPKVEYSGGADTKKAITDTAKDVAKEVENQFEETVDFFEERIEELNNALDLLKANLENVVGSFAKNKLIDAQIGINKESINNYSDALDMYTEKANEALSKLPSDIAEKVKNGAVAINDFVGDGNEEVVDAIKEYDKWADKVNECEQQLTELKEAIRDLELEKFNNVIDDFTDQFDLRENGIENIEKAIALFEETGQLVGESFYTAQKSQAEKQLEILEKQKEAMSKQLTSALKSGNIEKGTDEWYEMVGALQEVEGQILDCKKSIEEFDNAILELHWEVFERIQDQFSNLDSELGHLTNLFDDIEVADSSGAWTDDAITKLGLLAQQYELAQYNVDAYGEQIDKLNADYKAGKYSATEYSEKLAELTEGQWESVEAAEQAKDAIMELNEARVEAQIEGIEEEIDAYKELIDAKIAALDAEKDLESYRRSIQDKSGNISDLERKIAAMANDTTASTVAERLKLEEELAEAKEDLENFEYDHSIETQKNALNEQFTNFETEKNEEIEALRASLEEREALIAQSFETVKQNASLVGDQISQTAKEHGVQVSDSLTTSWKQGENSIAAYGETLSVNSSAFIENIASVEQQAWDLQEQANETSNGLAAMFSTQADTLVNELTESYNSEWNLANMTNALQQSLVNTLERGYDVSGITNSLGAVESAANSAKTAIESMLSAQANTPQKQGKYAIYEGDRIVGTADTEAGAKEFINGLVKSGRDASDFTIKAYAKGGIITRDDNNPLNNLAKAVGEDVIVAAKNSESILTPVQTEGLLNLAPMLDKFDSLWNVSNSIPMSLPPVMNTRNISNAPTVHFDNLINVQGNVGSALDVAQMQKIADKACDKLVDKINYSLKYH